MLTPTNIEKIESHHLEHNCTPSSSNCCLRNTRIFDYSLASLFPPNPATSLTTKEVTISEDNMTFNLLFHECYLHRVAISQYQMLLPICFLSICIFLLPYLINSKRVMCFENQKYRKKCAKRKCVCKALYFAGTPGRAIH